MLSKPFGLALSSLVDDGQGSDGVRALKHYIPCMHLTGQEPDPDVPVPDYHPLDYASLYGLLEASRTVRSDARATSDIQCRLSQAIPGSVCPNPTRGMYRAIAQEVDELYVSTLDLPVDDALALRFYRLLHPGFRSANADKQQPTNDTTEERQQQGEGK